MILKKNNDEGSKMIWKNGPILRTKFQRRDFRALGGGACGRSRAAAAISRAPSRRAEPNSGTGSKP
eukprot:COSAG06_NODE_1702_length_8663_cov_5.483652_9_plen_66_part_00